MKSKSSFSRLLSKLWVTLMTKFGDIKVFKFPFWLVYDPHYFKMTGKKILEVVDVIQPGDIILRGYDYYLDGKLLNYVTLSTANTPIGNCWSHGALYAGDNKVIHAVAEGVSEENIVDFCECDRIAIFRPKKGQKSAVKIAKKFLKDQIPYDFSFNAGSSALYCFELAALSYPKLNIPSYSYSRMLGILKKSNVYLAKSFVESPDIKLVWCYNPKFDIDFKDDNV